MNNARHLDLQVEELSWIKKYYPNMFDITASISIDGERWYGRGHSQDKDTALIIALSEAIERCVGLQKYQSSNGIATHTDVDSARINSRNELLERDLFLSHFLTRTAYACEKDYEFINASAVKFITSNNDKVRLFRTWPSNYGVCYIVLIYGEPMWGAIFGHCFGDQDAEILIEKAFLEAFRQYYHKRANNLLNTNYTLADFCNRSKWDFTDHELLALNVDYFAEIKKLFPNVSTDTHGSVAYRRDEFQVEILKPQNLLLCDSPFVSVRTTSVYAQNLKPGPFNLESISKKGLERFLGGHVHRIITNVPHPIN